MGNGNNDFDCRLCEQKEKACMAKLDASEKRLILRIEGLEKLNEAIHKGLADTVTRALDTCTDVLNIHDRALADLRKDISKKCVAMDEKVAYTLKEAKEYVDEELEEIKELREALVKLRTKIDKNLIGAKEYTDNALVNPNKHIRSLLNWRTYLFGAAGFIAFMGWVFKGPIMKHFFG